MNWINKNREVDDIARVSGKSVYIKTMGCQMNVRDSEVIKGLLRVEGYALVDDAKDADVVLFNTCSVREHAENKVWSEIGRFRKTKDERRRTKKTSHELRAMSYELHPNKPIIGLLGCMAQNFKEDVFKKAPAVDLVIGPSEIDNIALYLEEALRKQGPVLGVKERLRREEIYHTGFYEKKDHAYVVISEGCDNFCSYCIVPYVRGRLRYRPAAEIIKEVEAAVSAGIKNITLLGQNVNSYMTEGRETKDEGRKNDFVGLLWRISEVKGLKALSFVTSHPKDVTRQLFEAMRDIPVIKKSLHMPAQSGSERILAMMNRGYSGEKYRELVDLYRSVVYNGELSSDFIVGFPTEDEEDFQKTYALVRDLRFDSAFIFKYSPRPHTRALEFEDDVPMDIKKRRHTELLELQKAISKEKKEDRK